MKILNYGSMNVDNVYAVPHMVAPGETLLATGRQLFCGGKGLNQSIALARAGATVYHAGCIGAEGALLRELLQGDGVDVSLLREVDEAQGHTIIQVDRKGENCILLYGGSNRCITEAQIENLVTAKGYTDCVAFIGEDAISLAVAAPDGGLTQADTARIVDVVQQTAAFTTDQIKIIEVD